MTCTRSTRIWGQRRKSLVFLWSAIGFIIHSCITSSYADIHTVDVDAVVRKEQPDFEDDPNSMGANIVGPVPPVDTNPGSINKQHSPAPAEDNYIPSTVGVELDSSFMHAFLASLSIIVVSELGDKTFFISAIMAMSHPRLVVFAGAMLALAGMHVLSALFGFVITVIPRVYTFYASSALFAVFGLKMLREGYYMTADEGREELEEVQSDLRRRDDNLEMEPMEEGTVGVVKRGRSGMLGALVSRVFLQAFTMNVLAEWGDRSQIATVVMAAREEIYGVIVGGLIGHFLCTGLAVLGGRMVATRISIRTVTLIGGVVFLVFAVSSLIIGP